MKHQPLATVRGRRSATPKRERPTQAGKTPRWRKLQRLGQAHLAPGMSLQRWRDLLDLYDIGELAAAPDDRREEHAQASTRWSLKSVKL
jgi:hypothetical protein